MTRFFLASIVVLCIGCTRSGGQPLFELLGPGRTGIEFSNTIKTDDSVNVQSEVFIYNGGGVAVGDIDNDGLPDLFFTGNMVSSRLYLNKGDMRFEDITASAGVRTSVWASGVAMADVNDDGFLDLYVCVTGLKTSRGRDHLARGRHRIRGGLRRWRVFPARDGRGDRREEAGAVAAGHP